MWSYANSNVCIHHVSCFGSNLPGQNLNCSMLSAVSVYTRLLQLRLIPGLIVTRARNFLLALSYALSTICHINPSSIGHYLLIYPCLLYSIPCSPCILERRLAIYFKWKFQRYQQTKSIKTPKTPHFLKHFSYTFFIYFWPQQIENLDIKLNYQSILVKEREGKQIIKM